MIVDVIERDSDLFEVIQTEELCDDEQVLTVEETAQLLQVRPTTVRRWLREGHLPALKLERVWRIQEVDSLAHVSRHHDTEAAVTRNLALSL